MKQSVIPLVTAMVLMGPLKGTADTLPMPLDVPKPFPNIYDLPMNELDPFAMESTRGGLGPLAIALGIAGVDLALMGFFWGVYVPYYAPSEPGYYTEAP